MNTRKATKDKKAAYKQFKALHYIECYEEDKSKLHRYGIEYDLEDIMLMDEWWYFSLSMLN